MRRHGNLFIRLTDIKTCEEALKKAKRHKTARRNVKRVLKAPEFYINGARELMLNGSYRTSGFHNKLVHEPKLRLIYSLPFYPDRIVHHAMMIILEPIWDGLMYKHSYACRTGKGQHKASRQCLIWTKQYKYVAQLDISQFYINLDHELLKQVVRRKIKDKRMLALIDENIDAVDIRANNIRLYKKLIEQGVSVKEAKIGLEKLENARALNDGRAAGVAVGSLPSQWLGNLYLTDFDFYVTATLKHKAYMRFCDDLLIFSNDKAELNELVNKCRDYLLMEKRLTLSKVRLYPTSRGVDFCGYRHFPSGIILLRKRTVKAAKARLKAIPHALRRGKLSKDKAISKIASTQGWMKHANTYNLSKALAINDLLDEVKAYEKV